MRIQGVPTLRHIDRKEHQCRWRARAPYVAKGLTASWPALRSWSIDDFRNRFANRKVPVRICAQMTEPYKSGRLMLGQYVDYLRGKLKHDALLYVADWEISGTFPELVEETRPLSVFEPDLMDGLPSELQFPRLWIFLGHPQVYTPLHIDPYSTSAWLTMFEGSKTVRISEPFSFEPETSLFDEPPTDVRIWETTLAKGDTLYVPGRFPHEIRNPEPNLMLTKNFLEDYCQREFLETRIA